MSCMEDFSTPPENMPVGELGMLNYYRSEKVHESYPGFKLTSDSVVPGLARDSS